MIASKVTVGTKLNLEADKYADPQHNKPELEFEWAVIEEILAGHPGCIELVTSCGWFGFPPDHDIVIDES